MDPSFWHERWTENRIGFHNAQANRKLAKHFARLDLGQGARVFLPLCGKTLDIDWLLAQGHRAVGAELSAVAVKAVFERLDLSPEVEQSGALTRYRCPDLELYAGDIFDLSADMLGPVDAIYDRAALVALPEKMRARYAAHLTAITRTAPQLLLSFSYDQTRMDGPPFSVTEDMVSALYDDAYRKELLERAPNQGNLAERAGGTEETWLLTGAGSVDGA